MVRQAHHERLLKEHMVAATICSSPVCRLRRRHCSCRGSLPTSAGRCLPALTVEDDPGMQSLLIKRLNANGFDCVGAYTVEEALRSLKKTKPDLVLLDLGFQKTDGTAFLENFEQWLDEKKKRPPVIVVSGHKDKEIVEYVLDAGAADFIGKPFEPKDLVKIVRNHI